MATRRNGHVPTLGQLRGGCVARMKVEQVLRAVEQLTIMQSEDPGWFLARAFMFTSRTSHSFVQAVASNYEEYISGLAYLIRGRNLMHLANVMPSEFSHVEERIRPHWDAVLELLNIRKRSREEPVTLDTVTTFMNMSESALREMRKEQLINLLVSVGRGASASLRKQQLIEKIKELQSGVREGAEVLQVEEREERSMEARAYDNGQQLSTALYRTSLSAWVMKPLVATSGMKEGSLNETEVLKAIPVFFEQHRAIDTSSFAREGRFITKKLRIDYVRSVGLLSNRTAAMLADSADGLIGVVEQSGEAYCCSVEIKTMTSPRTVEEARKVADELDPLCEINDVGSTPISREHFHKFVPKTEYRLQCLHHAACLGSRHVLFVVAKGSSMGVGEIIYAVLLHFAEQRRNMYLYCLDTIRVSSFNWVGGDGRGIPSQYDDMLQASHASDLISFASFYNLSKAYKELVSRHGPLPPARMIRPTVLVYWNALKGGVDEFSRALTSLAYTNASENPIVSVIGRLLSSQVNNAAIIYRLSIARKARRLPDATRSQEAERMGYHKVRHEVTKCLTFASFARGLAKEYKIKYIEGTGPDNGGGTANVSDFDNSTVAIKPMYASKAVEKYNRTLDRARRLNGSNGHQRVKAKATYCSLGSYNFHWIYKGKKFTKRGVRRKSNGCNVFTAYLFSLLGWAE